MTDIFRSERLLYRAVSTEDDLPLFEAINNDKIGYQNSNASNIRLPTKDDAKDFMKGVSEDLLGAVIVVAAPSGGMPTPIGQVHLKAPGKYQGHHRNSEVGIDILPAHQGKGYGSEAIRWALEYAFQRAGLHRVGIKAFGWNDGAIRLYERLGFKIEGREREALWHDGRWWDAVEFGMLEDEWRESQR